MPTTLPGALGTKHYAVIVYWQNKRSRMFTVLINGENRTNDIEEIRINQYEKDKHYGP